MDCAASMRLNYRSDVCSLSVLYFVAAIERDERQSFFFAFNKLIIFRVDDVE